MPVVSGGNRPVHVREPGHVHDAHRDSTSRVADGRGAQHRPARPRRTPIRQRAGPGCSIISTQNRIDHSGDLLQQSVYAVSAGSPLTIASTSNISVDYGVVIIAIHGVSDLLPFPYEMPLENWPVLVTEIGSGSMTTNNPLFAQQMSGWNTSGASGTVTAVTWPRSSREPGLRAVRPRLRRAGRASRHVRERLPAVCPVPGVHGSAVQDALGLHLHADRVQHRRPAADGHRRLRRHQLVRRYLDPVLRDHHHADRDRAPEHGRC